MSGLEQAAEQGEGTTSEATELPVEYGRLVSPLPVDHCANAACSHDEGLAALNEHGAYLYRDIETDKLVVLCGDCSRHVELNHRERFKLVAL